MVQQDKHLQVCNSHVRCGHCVWSRCFNHLPINTHTHMFCGCRFGEHSGQLKLPCQAREQRLGLFSHPFGAAGALFTLGVAQVCA